MTSALAPPAAKLIVQRQFYTFAEPPNPMPLDSGASLGPITLAYETLGTLNSERSNAVLILHAFSGDSHVAGYLSESDTRPGWWDSMVGPGKAIDTHIYFVICINILGSCAGSTGPASINPATGDYYALSFPMVTIGDMVRAQKHLIDHLGIKKLMALIGGSVGGMQVLQWCVAYPEMVRAAIPLATTGRHSPQAIAFKLTVMREQRSDLYQHSLQMTLVAIFLALKNGWTERECVPLATAALLHDVGMLYMDPVWTDPDHRLSGEERKHLVAHSVTAMLVVRSTELYSRAVEIAVLEHHEVLLQ